MTRPPVVVTGPTEDAPAHEVGSSTLGVLLLASTLSVMAGSIIVPVLELIRSDLQVGATEAGLIITVHGLAIAVASPAMGAVIDRFGLRLVLTGGLVLYGVAGGAGLFVSSYPALVLGRLLFGVGAAAVFSATTTALLTYYQGPRQDRVVGWRTTATSLGGLVWPLVGGALGGISWHAPFAVYLVAIPLGAAALAALPPTSTGLPAHRSEGGVIRLLVRRPALFRLYGLLLASAAFLYVVAIFVPRRLGELGITHPVIVAVYAVMTASATMSLVGLGYGRIRDRFRYRTLLRIAAGAWVAAFLVLATVDQPGVLLVAPVLFGVGQALAIPALTSLVGRSAPAGQRGRATALIGTAVFAGQFLSPVLIGPLVTATSVTTAFLAVAGSAALILLALVVLPRRETSGTPDVA